MSHAHLQYACNNCAKFKIEYLPENSGQSLVSYLIMKPNLNIVLVENAVILSKFMSFFFTKSHAHL